MKRAQIEYEVCNGLARVTGWSNVATYLEIVDTFGDTQAFDYIHKGPHFYLVNDKKYMAKMGYKKEYLRVYTGKASLAIFVGSKFDAREMESIISSMKIAGERFSKMRRKVIVKI